MGNAIGTATQWLFNFVMTRITPPAIENIGWRTFLMFAIFNFVLSIYAFFLIKETTGKSLEDMERGELTFLTLSVSGLVNRANGTG